MTRPFIECHKFDLGLVFKDTRIIEISFAFETLKEARSVLFWFGRFLSRVQIHLLKNYPTYMNQIPLTSVKVTALTMDIFHSNQWIFT